MAPHSTMLTAHRLDPAFPIAIVRQNPQRPMGLHGHPFTELVVILEGRGVHVTDDDEYEIAAGDVFVVAESESHGYRDTGELVLVNLLFDPGALALPHESLNTLPGYHALLHLEPGYRRRDRFASRLRLDLDDLARARVWLDRIEEEIESRAPGFEALATAALTELLVFLSRCYGAMKSRPARAVVRVGEVLSHLERHFDRDTPLAELAAMAHMSESSLLRAFKRATGRTPVDYRVRLRIARAAEFLAREDLSVTEIAFRVGFTDSNYFSRQFRRIMGASPTAYREGASRGRVR